MIAPNGHDSVIEQLYARLSAIPAGTEDHARTTVELSLRLVCDTSCPHDEATRSSLLDEAIHLLDSAGEHVPATDSLHDERVYHSGLLKASRFMEYGGSQEDENEARILLERSAEALGAEAAEHAKMVLRLLNVRSALARHVGVRNGTDNETLLNSILQSRSGLDMTVVSEIREELSHFSSSATSDTVSDGVAAAAAAVTPHQALQPPPGVMEQAQEGDWYEQLLAGVPDDSTVNLLTKAESARASWCLPVRQESLVQELEAALAVEPSHTLAHTLLLRELAVAHATHEMHTGRPAEAAHVEDLFQRALSGMEAGHPLHDETLEMLLGFLVLKVTMLPSRAAFLRTHRMAEQLVESRRHRGDADLTARALYMLGTLEAARGHLLVEEQADDA
jgi:hypothetical protein